MHTASERGRQDRAKWPIRTAVHQCHTLGHLHDRLKKPWPERKLASFTGGVLDTGPTGEILIR